MNPEKCTCGFVNFTNENLIQAAPELLIAAKEASIMLSGIAELAKQDIKKSPGFMRLFNAIRKAEGKSAL